MADSTANSQQPVTKPIIGLVGQVCAGKSTVADAFRRRGALVYDADAAVRELYTFPEAADEVRRMFGPGVVGQDGTVDRGALAKIVFADPAKLEELTSQIVFPRTGKAIADEIEKFRTSTAPMLVLDAPTLFESGRDGMCTRIVFVAAPLERRKIWAASRGWDAQELERRESRLLNEAQKRERADWVIDNAGALEDVDRQVEECVKKFVPK